MPQTDNHSPQSIKKMNALHIKKAHEIAGLSFEVGDAEKWGAELSSRASMALNQRETSYWWLYVVLHTKYINTYPDAKPLPGFPDMDTAVKTGCPSIYNWYYHYKKYPLVDIDLMNITDHLALSFSNPLNCDYDLTWSRHVSWPLDLQNLKDGTTLPFWLFKNVASTKVWPVILEYAHQPYIGALISAPNKIATQILPAKMIWQYLMLDKFFTVGTMKPTLTLTEQCTSLDELRFSHLHQNERLMGYAKNNFLKLHPEMATHISIAFDLGAPLVINLPEDIKPDPAIWSPEI